MNDSLKGTNLAGGKGSRDRVENDYYATPRNSTLSLLEKETFKGTILEPCVGGGHIAEVLEKVEGVEKVIGVDIVDRGYKDTIVTDYMSFCTSDQIDHVVTNPPYAIAQKFLEKSMEVVRNKGKIAMFLKIQFLEGKARKEMFEKYPPKKIYVFSERQNPLRNGSPVDETGKKWNSTMCFAWFVWEKGFTGKPEVEWL